MVEILVHWAVLPKDFILTPVQIPDHIDVTTVPVATLPSNWNDPGAPLDPTQAIGLDWIESKRSAVLGVPSAVVPQELNYVLDVAHPDFLQIKFLPSQPFRFDPRLK